MIPAILGLGGLTAKIIASAVIPRVVRAISSSFSTTKANEPCPPPAVEGISSVSDTPPVPPGSGVFVPRESLRKWGYAGLWHHQASGLDLATYRAYDAANKRWISRDPLGEGVDANLYRYCKNSPVGCLDPEGLDPLNSAQTANVNAAINVVNQVDPATSTGLAGLLQSGDIYQSGPTVSKFARGFTPTGSIGISPDWLSADPILLSVLLVHEYEHVKQERCGKWNKRFQIVLYLVTGFQINRDLELPAYNAQQDYMRKLRTIGTLHPSTSVQSQLNSLYEEGATRIENLRLWGQIDSGL